jgi:hypothetical protein
LVEVPTQAAWALPASAMPETAASVAASAAMRWEELRESRWDGTGLPVTSELIPDIFFGFQKS